MIVSTVILTHNSTAFISACLDSLYRELPTDSEIIVVDNGSVDGSVSLIRSSYPSVKLIENPINRGIAPARNQGLRCALGDFILILDVDTVVQPGAIHALLKSMSDDAAVGLSAAQLRSMDGRLQYTCRNFPTLWTKVARQLPAALQQTILEKSEYRSWDHSHPRYVGYVIGACQFIRRAALLEVGLYDERIFYGPEDVDYCLRMWKSGWRVLYDPRAVILHLERRVTRKRPLTNRLTWLHFKGLVWFFWKHKYLMNPPCQEIIAVRTS